MRPLPRRTFLKGVGTALALPFLDAMTPLSRLSGSVFAASAPPAPTRLAFLFIPNGVHYQDWAPRGEGHDYELSSLLAPLEPHKRELLILSGLAHRNARALGDGPGDHARSAACFLTGAHPVKTAGSNIEVGTSIDQVIARHVGQDTRFPSLELGTEAGLTSGRCDSGYSCAYSSNISWRTPHAPMTKEINPRHVFERLFGLGPGRESAQARAERLRTRRSILDFVREDAATLRSRLGAADRRKVDEYFDGVRALERRLELVESVDRDPEQIAGMKAPAGIPRSYAEHVKLMCDLMVLAFRLDLTRVVTFMLANEGSNRGFPELDIRDGHHHLSHHRGDRTKIARIRAINRFQSELFAYAVEQLQAVEEGEGTLLDSSLVLFGSAISDGNRHNHDDLPIILAGRGGGAVTPGRHVRYPKDTPLANLFVTLMNHMGMPEADSFGDSRGRLGKLRSM